MSAGIWEKTWLKLVSSKQANDRKMYSESRAKLGGILYFRKLIISQKVWTSSKVSFRRSLCRKDLGGGSRTFLRPIRYHSPSPGCSVREQGAEWRQVTVA